MLPVLSNLNDYAILTDYCKIHSIQPELKSNVEDNLMTEQPINPDITSDDKLWAALSYAFSPLIPLILMLMDDKKNRAF